MPNAFLEKLAKSKKYGSKKELEQKWEKAKQLAKDEGHEDDYAYIMGIFKRMIGYKNENNVLDEDNLLLEAIDVENTPSRGKRFYDLYAGRFQPLHIGHYKIIMRMHNPVVAIVRGKKSSQDSKKNPFSLSTQMYLFRLVFGGGVRVIVAENAYIPDIFNRLRLEGMEPLVLWCGEDRIEGYRRQIERYNKLLEEKGLFDRQYIVSLKVGPRATSATKIRELLASGKYDEYVHLVPEPMRGRKIFDMLRKELLNARGGNK